SALADVANAPTGAMLARIERMTFIRPPRPSVLLVSLLPPWQRVHRLCAPGEHCTPIGGPPQANDSPCEERLLPGTGPGSAPAPGRERAGARRRVASGACTS